VVASGGAISGPPQGHSDCVCSVAFAPDGKRVVSGSFGKRARIWDVESGVLSRDHWRATSALSCLLLSHRTVDESSQGHQTIQSGYGMRNQGM